MVHIVYTKHVTSNWPKSGLVFKSLTSEWQAHDSFFFAIIIYLYFSIIIYLYFKLYYIYNLYIYMHHSNLLILVHMGMRIW